MRQSLWVVRASSVLAIAAILAGCHHANPNPAPGPTMSSAQMEKGIAGIQNNPNMSPQQKAQMIQMIRDHVKTTGK